jgi:acetolactate synthase regulatory subunit
MTHRLRLELHPEPGALQRVIVHVSRRGFEPVSVHAHRTCVELELQGDRPVAPLARLLGGLADVKTVEVVE